MDDVKDVPVEGKKKPGKTLVPITLSEAHTLNGKRYGPGRNILVPQELVPQMRHTEHMLQQAEVNLKRNNGSNVDLGSISGKAS